MLYTIYKVTHRDTGICYIGKHQTLDPNDGYMGSGKRIINAVKKHGVEAFRKEVLHVFETEAEMNTKEAELVTEEFCLRKDTYNLCPGGRGGWGYINANADKFLNATRKQNSAKGGYATKGLRTGISLSLEHREKITIARQGRDCSNFKGNKFACGMWITNEVEVKKIKPDGIIPEGWRRGRLKKSSCGSVNG